MWAASSLEAGYLRLNANHATPEARAILTRGCSLLALALLCLSPACASDGRSKLQLVNSRGETVTLRVEIADEPHELQRGLMGRTSLPRNQGMLFVIEQRGAGFYMKDVPIPLSVAFISACGVILDIQDMQPNTFDLHDHAGDYRYGLETNQGWFSSNDVRAGTTVRLPSQLQKSSCPG